MSPCLLVSLISHSFIAVAHRDIKPENVLMVNLEDDHSIKICDFGFAKRVPRPFCLRTLCGTAQYVAPEVLDLQSAGYDQRADMWSVGVVVYILLGGYAPFEGPVHELAQAICKADYCFHDKYWSDISEAAKKMISQLLQVDCTKRLSAEEALQCPWMIIEEETLTVKDLSGAQAAMKERKQDEAVDAIRAAHNLEVGDVSFTATLGTFEEVASRKAKRTEMVSTLKPLDEDSTFIEDSSSGKPFETIYQWGKLLGEGGFSVTHEARHRQTKSVFAVKRVERADLDEYAAVALQNEISALQMVSECPYILRLYDVFDEADFTYMVMERLKGGELIDRIGEKSCYTEEDARIVCEKVLLGLEHCHNKRIAHRNIKAENLILTNKRSYVDVKISDFGFAKRVLFPNSLTTQCGTEGYTAPEILEHHPTYDVQCDMWSLGVVLYIMLGGYRPFRGEGQDITRQIRYGEYKFHKRYWKDTSEEAKILISRMLTVNPIGRITVRAALQSDWIAMDHSYVSDESDGEQGDKGKKSSDVKEARIEI
jgi:serine/threonine protein kinase